MTRLIEEATQREQERFEVREREIISESEEKLQKKEEIIATLKKEIETLTEEKDTIAAEKMYVVLKFFLKLFQMTIADD